MEMVLEEWVVLTPEPDGSAAMDVGDDLLQGVNIPRIQRNRLLANRVCVSPQGETDICVMQVIWRTDRQVIHFLSAATPTLFQVPIEATAICPIGVSRADSVSVSRTPRAM
jgi:hypothetical protein